MLSFIKGILADKGFGTIVIDNHGIGYEINVTSFCENTIGTIGEEVQVYTYLNVREDEMTLFGFRDKFEKEVFLKLLLVNGVGPKMAINILSGVSAQDLSFAIATQNASVFKGIKGVGAKIRDRILLELKEKIDALSHLAEVDMTACELNQSENFAQALTVLTDWGVPKSQAQDILTKVYDTNDTMENLIAKAFKELGR